MIKPIDSHPDALLLFQTKKGSVWYCSHCHKVNIEFENLLVDFTLQEFLSFRYSIDVVNFNEIAEKNACLPYRRKLIWEFPNAALKGIFHLDEVDELSLLVRGAESALTQFHLRGIASFYPTN